MIKRIFKNELAQKIVFTILILFVMELGRQITLPELNQKAIESTLSTNSFLVALSTATGGQVNRLTLFSIGLGPYMTGMILFQALQMLDVEALKSLSQRQIGLVQRYIALFIAFIQSAQMVYLTRNSILKSSDSILGVNVNLIYVFLVLVTGAMIVSWLSDTIVDRGLGGSGILIFPGLINSLPRLLMRGQGMGSSNFELTAFNIVVLVISLVVVILASIFMNRAELRLPLQRPMIEGTFSESYLPIRVLTAGSMPFMFTTSVFMIPSYMASFGLNESVTQFINNYFAFDNPIGIVIYLGIIFLLSFAFAYMNFRPEDTVKTIKEGGDYFFGKAPGDETYRYVVHHMLLLSTISGIFFVIIIGLPLVIGLYVDGITNLAFVFSNVLILLTVMDNLSEQIRVMYLRTQYDLLKL